MTFRAPNLSLPQRLPTQPPPPQPYYNRALLATVPQPAPFNQYSWPLVGLHTVRDSGFPVSLRTWLGNGNGQRGTFLLGQDTFYGAPGEFINRDSLNRLPLRAPPSTLPATTQTPSWLLYFGTAGNTYSVSVTEAASASDSEDSTYTTSATITEAGSAADTDSAVFTTAVAITEAASATDTTASGALYSDGVTESASASDADVSTAVFAAAQTESGTATDAESVIATFAASLTEAASAADAVAGAAILPATITESGNATDAESAAGNQVYNDSVTEAASATDAVSTQKPIASTGWISRATKRWWEELQDEYKEKWDRESPAPSRSRKAIAARKAVVAQANEAISHGLFSEQSARPLAELVTKTLYSNKLVDTLEAAEHVREYINMVREQDDEDDILIMAMAL